MKISASKTEMKVAYLIILLVLVGLSFNAVAFSEKHYNFKVFLDDKEIGKHAVHVIENQNSKKVTVDANFKVKFLFFTAYQYQHRAEEEWEGSCLKNIEVNTDDNGDNLFIRKTSDRSDFIVETHAGTQKLGDCVRSFAYWDLDLLRAQKLLNTQTGDYESVEILDLGRDQFEVDGQQVDALKYRLVVGDKAVDLWYTSNMNWLALQSTLDSGYRLSYYPEVIAF